MTSLTNGSPNCTACKSGYSGTPCTLNVIVCGDAIIEGSEVCDDGNIINGDGCSSTCTVEFGYTCTGSPESVCSSTCGDSQKASNEACDEGSSNGLG